MRLGCTESATTYYTRRLQYDLLASFFIHFILISVHAGSSSPCFHVYHHSIQLELTRLANGTFLKFRFRFVLQEVTSHRYMLTLDRWGIESDTTEYKRGLRRPDVPSGEPAYLCTSQGSSVFKAKLLPDLDFRFRPELAGAWMLWADVPAVAGCLLCPP